MSALPKPEKRGPKPKRRMNVAGVRTLEWSRVRARLKKRFAAWGITRCEFAFIGCTRSQQLSFAHAVKRRFLSATAAPGTAEHIETVAVCCLVCHQQLDEGMSHQAMRASVLSVIATRR